MCAGLTFEIDGIEDPKQRPGACFWVPKVLLVSVLWTISVAGYMYIRIMQLSDPSYSITETFGQYGQWAMSFVAGLVGVYVLYLFALLVLSCRHFKTMRPSFRYIVAMTLTTFITIACGLFLNAFTQLRETSVLFLASTGVANLYVWQLLVLHLPAASASWENTAPVAWGGTAGGTQLPPSASKDEEVTAADVAVAIGAAAPAVVGGRHGGHGNASHLPDAYSDEAQEAVPSHDDFATDHDAGQGDVQAAVDK